MTISYHEAVAIAQVLFFVPALLGGIFLALRHGFSKSSGWVLLITFSLLRLIGAVLEIIGIEHPSKSVITGAIVCISIGISPLTLICLGLLARVNQSIGMVIPRFIFQIISTLSLAALCLGIYGGTELASSAGRTSYTHLNTYSKVAVLIFVAIFVVVFLMFLVLATKISDLPQGEKRPIVSVTLSFPLLTIRYIYALLVDLTQDTRFNSYFGNATYYLCMAVLTEFVVLVICEATGFTLRVIPKEERDIEAVEMIRGHVPVSSNDSSMSSVQMRDGRKAGMPKRKFTGPISWLFFLVKDAISARRGRK